MQKQVYKINEVFKTDPDAAVAKLKKADIKTRLKMLINLLDTMSTADFEKAVPYLRKFDREMSAIQIANKTYPNPGEDIALLHSRAVDNFERIKEYLAKSAKLAKAGTAAVPA